MKIKDLVESSGSPLLEVFKDLDRAKDSLGDTMNYLNDAAQPFVLDKTHYVNAKDPTIKKMQTLLGNIRSVVSDISKFEKAINQLSMDANSVERSMLGEK